MYYYSKSYEYFKKNTISNKEDRNMTVCINFNNFLIALESEWEN